MSTSSRVFRLMEAELNRSLAFSFSIVGQERLTNGAGQVVLPERFRFKVWVRNNSGLAIQKVIGSITPSIAATFDSTTFRIPHLGPRQHREVAEIAAIRGAVAIDRHTLNRVAAISVKCEVDLSGFRFTDTYRPLPYEQPAAPERRPDHVYDDGRVNRRKIAVGECPWANVPGIPIDR